MFDDTCTYLLDLFKNSVMFKKIHNQEIHIKV